MLLHVLLRALGVAKPIVGWFMHLGAQDALYVPEHVRHRGIYIVWLRVARGLALLTYLGLS